MAGNLTREEARTRARLVTVDSYDVALDLTVGDAAFRSTTVLRFRCAESGADTFVDIAASRIREITVNGRAVPADDAFAGGRVRLADLSTDNEVRIVADCAYSRTGEGLHRFVDPVDGQVYLYSQFETADAHRMYACFDQPDLKASLELTVTCPQGWVVVSNEAPDVEAQPTGDGAARWHFPPTPRISPYITALIAGPYHRVAAEHDGIPLGVYCRASLAEHLDADEIFAVTRQGLDFFQRVFGMPYPFGKYDQLFVPEFNAGAMENAGAVTFLEDYVFRSRVTDAAYERRAETILHEMAHMWFGDLVTMRWWDDLWLNESFATFMSVFCQAEATRWSNAWTTFANLWKAWAYRQDQLPSTHPIAADIPDMHAVEVNFDGITYAKGAAVLKQLVAWVGTDAFLAAMRSYFRRHAWGNTTLQDLLSALEETSGRDLTTWSKQWLETAGVNTVRPEFDVDAAGDFISFAVLQEAPGDHPTLRSHRLAIGVYGWEGGDGTGGDGTGGDGPRLVRKHRVELDVEGDRTPVPQLVGVPRGELVLLNDDDLTYAKVRLDPHSLRTLVDHIADIRDPLPRALCWGAAWDMCRDAELPAREYVRLVVSAIRGVPDISVLQTLLRQARTVAYQYADPGWRERGTVYLADALHEHLRAADSGSDRQLAFAQAFAEVAASDAHLETLAGLLDGTVTIAGLRMDTDLRWSVLRRLVTRGAAGPAEIDAELSRDRTAAGERQAATCRALLPTRDAKAEAWHRLMDGKQLPHAMVRAIIAGFYHPEQLDTVRPYAQHYFDVVGDIWESWSGEMAQSFAVGMYPAVLVEQETVDLTDAYLAGNDPPPALRRLLLEGRDGVVRALRARQRDRAEATEATQEEHGPASG